MGMNLCHHCQRPITAWIPEGITGVFFHQKCFTESQRIKNYARVVNDIDSARANRNSGGRKSKKMAVTNGVRD